MLPRLLPQGNICPVYTLWIGIIMLPGPPAGGRNIFGANYPWTLSFATGELCYWSMLNSPHGLL